MTSTPAHCLLPVPGMNAIESMTRESSLAGFTRNEQLRVLVSPLAAYEFNTRALLDAEFRGSAKAQLHEFIARHDLPASFGAAIDDRSVAAIVPDQEQLAMFDLLHLTTRKTGSDPQPARYTGDMPPFICVVIGYSITCMILIIHQNVSDLEFSE
jgi:hypothetical protein